MLLDSQSYRVSRRFSSLFSFPHFMLERSSCCGHRTNYTFSKSILFHTISVFYICNEWVWNDLSYLSRWISEQWIRKKDVCDPANGNTVSCTLSDQDVLLLTRENFRLLSWSLRVRLTAFLLAWSQFVYIYKYEISRISQKPNECKHFMTK